MGQNWDDYDRAAAKGPFSIAVKVILGIFALGALIGVLGYGFGWFSEAAQVAKEELGPRALLKKYSWFKDTAQQLQAKKANIDTAETDLGAVKAEWANVPATQVPRDVRESWEQRRAELRGLKANFNQLAAEYNANVRKVNWSAMNTENLPAEFTEYVVQ